MRINPNREVTLEYETYLYGESWVRIPKKSQ